MVSGEILIALLGSAVAASLITALFAKAQSDKSAVVDNIIKERKAWRDKLRALVSETESAFEARNSNSVASIEAQLVVLLNPYDKDDLDIIRALKQIPGSWEQASFQEFMDRVAYLLKHDWERVKQESTTRISPQTLALASFVFGLIIFFTALVFDLGAELLIARHLAFWLSGVFITVAVVSNRPRGKFTAKKILCWIANEPYREPYKDRDKR
ncbi:hypothetical protein [Halovibrio sp. HP20-50]|uniref:hypothetical protein n=1 Tax=Halovibrio sp. HP20-59 TaxID=3080275 RepID=UPI00294ADDFD|nr:hypothetical protein [Halovibrio sp. HP20-59]MEA2119949.1 hypothetical protein [Halovibrio sp. HP20-59]